MKIDKIELKAQNAPNVFMAATCCRGGLKWDGGCRGVWAGPREAATAGNVG